MSQPVLVIFDSPDEMAELVRLCAEDGVRAVLTPAHTGDDGRQRFTFSTEPA